MAVPRQEELDLSSSGIGDFRVGFKSLLSYVGLPLCLAQSLQLGKDAVAQLLTGVRPCQHATSLHRDLHWLTICYWSKFKVLLLGTSFLVGPPYSIYAHLTTHGRLQGM